MPTSSLLLITVITAYYSEYVHLQNFLLPLSHLPLRALKLSTPTLPSSFFSELYDTSMGHARLVCTQFFFYPPHGRSGPTGSFFLQRIALNDPTITLSYNNILSRINIDGFRLYVCS
jgi:hypothetical protein